MKLSRLALATALLPLAAHAEPPHSHQDALKLPALMITSGRQVETRQQAIAASSVFTRQDIESLQPSSVLDLLKRAPGVQITQSGGRGSLSGLFIRGTKTAQSIVLVDGQRIADVSTGNHFLEWLSVDQIERVEIIRGPRSTLYGADAIGGVIQIFTRRAAAGQRNAQLRIGYGSNQTWERSANLALADDETRLSLNASSSDTQGIDRTRHANAGADRDAYRNNGLGLSLNHRFSPNLDLGLNLLQQQGEVEFDNDSGGTRPYQEFQISSQSFYADTKLNDIWGSRVELGHSENRYKTAYDDNDSSRHNYTYRDSAAWLNTLSLNEQQNILIGADWLEDRLHSNNTYSQTSRWNRGLVLQHQYRGEALSTELGARHDKNQQFGGHSTFNAALTWHLDLDNDLILSYAEGFRAPSFQDIYAPPGWGANPDLQPEESKSIELQWRSQLAQDTSLEASLYRNKIKNAIVADDTWTMQNLDRARINGLEIALQQRLGEWQGSLGLSLVDPRDVDSGHTLNRRARRTLNLDLDRQIGTFSLGAGWQAVSSSYDDMNNQRRLPGYGLLGLRGSWQASNDTQLALKIDNLLDKNYSRAQYAVGWPSTYYSYREEGRSALLSFTWSPDL